jgi:hypothetical protein
LKQNYETKYVGQCDCYSDQLRNYKISLYKSPLCRQQNIFKMHCNETKAGIHVSYEVAEQLARKGKPYTDAELVKSCSC